MQKEQQVKVVTFIKLDFFDALKCLFGKKIKLDSTIVIPQELEIKMCNAYSTVQVISETTYIKFQDKPSFGYTCGSDPEK